MTLNAMVVGLGAIGMGYDLKLSDEFVLTHARAFRRHPSYELVAGVDEDVSRRSMFEAEFGRPAYASVDEALRHHRVDVASIAVPTSLHELVLTAALAGRPKAILCEKPLAFEYASAAQMIDSCDRAGCALFVNYSRRSEPGAREVKRRISAGELSAPLKGVVWYTKGLLNNGSHFLNLLEDWLGDVTAFSILETGRRWADTDPEPDVRIHFSAGSVYFLAAKEEDFSHRCFELIGASGRLRYDAEGVRISWEAVEADPVFEGYRVLSSQLEFIPTDAHRSLWHVVEQMAEGVAGRPASICSGADAIRTSRILSDITASTREHSRDTPNA